MTPEQTATYYKNKALKEVGIHKHNAIFEVRFAFATQAGGSFLVSFNDVQSAPIAYAPSAEVFQAALVAIPTFGPGVEVNGVIGGPYYIEVGGGNSGQVVPSPLIDGSNLNPVQTPVAALLRQGKTVGSIDDVNEIWGTHEGEKTTLLRFYKTKLDLIDARIGDLADAMDVTTGQVNVVTAKENQRMQNMERMRARVKDDINAEINSSNAGLSRTFGGVITKTTSNGLPRRVLGFNPQNGRYE